MAPKKTSGEAAVAVEPPCPACLGKTVAQLFMLGQRKAPYQPTRRALQYIQLTAADCIFHVGTNVRHTVVYTVQWWDTHTQLHASELPTPASLAAT